MTPINYVLLLQKWSLISFGVSLGALLILLNTVSPYSNPSAIWIFLCTAWVIGSSSFLLGVSFWVFKIQKKLLTVAEINSLVYNSLVSSSILVYILVLIQTDKFNLIWAIGITFFYSIYQIWLNLKEK